MKIFVINKALKWDKDWLILSNKWYIDIIISISELIKFVLINQKKENV